MATLAITLRRRGSSQLQSHQVYPSSGASSSALLSSSARCAAMPITNDTHSHLWRHCRTIALPHTVFDCNNTLNCLDDVQSMGIKTYAQNGYSSALESQTKIPISRITLMYGLLSLQFPVDELVRGLLFFQVECHYLYQNC